VRDALAFLVQQSDIERYRCPRAAGNGNPQLSSTGYRRTKPATSPNLRSGRGPLRLRGRCRGG
jgi:hypothetical protein